jgi:hypothetical protein
VDAATAYSYVKAHRRSLQFSTQCGPLWTPHFSMSGLTRTYWRHGRGEPLDSIISCVISRSPWAVATSGELLPSPDDAGTLRK